MKPLIILCFTISLLFFCCSKKSKPDNPTNNGDVVSKTETANGISFKVYTLKDATQLKGILVMGSGNDESNPSPGSLDGGPENELSAKAAKNGYLAAIVQYRKTPGNADWNGSAEMIGEDYDKCISALAAEYSIDKSRSVVGGYSYASFMLLTDIALNNTLSYCKGVLAACGATAQWDAEHFSIPVFSIACSGNNEGDYSGKELYDKIPAGSTVKNQSGGVTDNSCNTHCGGSWTDQLYNRLVAWLP
jgi:hypothetical protein